MIIAKKLRETNIAEYLLYMWQVEDLIRAYNLDIDLIDKALLSQYDQDENTKLDTRHWYQGLIEMMRREDKQLTGHLVVNHNVIIELTELHLRLLASPKQTEYNAHYYKTLPFVVELRTKADNKNIPELETCFAALYGYLLMRLQKKEISGETQAAIAQIGSLLRLLSQKYKEDKDKGLDL